jgi:acetyl-CoA C-acetyltransferase
VTLNRFCGSGLEAVNDAAAKVAAGFADLTIGGGVESMSRVAMGSDGGALWDPTFEWRYGTVPQGISADLLATIRGFTRADVDAFALQSQRRRPPPGSAASSTRSVVPVHRHERSPSCWPRTSTCARTPRSRASPSSRPPSR